MSEDGGRSSPLPLLQGTTFVATLDRFVMPPMLVAIAADLGVPLAEAVRAGAAYFLAYGLLQPVWGGVADRLGRVRTMQLTLILAGVAGLVSALAWSAVSLAVLRGIAGGLFGAAYPSALIYVGDTVDRRHRQRDIARLMVGVALGTGLASLLGGLLASLDLWRAGFLITGASALLVGYRLRRLSEPTSTERSTSSASLRQIGRSPWAWLVLGLACAEGVVILGVLTLLPAAIESSGVSAGLSGAVTAGYAVAVLLGARLVGTMSARWPTWRLIALGGAAAVAAAGLLAIARGPALGVVGAALLGMAWTFMHSSLQTWATEVLPTARSMMVALFASSLFVGSALGPVAVSAPASHGRFGLAFGVLAGLAIPLVLVAAASRARWQPSSRPGPGDAPVG